MAERLVLTGARIFDGEEWYDDVALVVGDGAVEGVAADDYPADARRIALPGGMLVPGFIDIQVNGAGGVQFNEEPTLETVATICRTGMRFGVTACLPTLITDTPEVTDRAVEAGLDAARRHVPGFLGLHLEGPHLAASRKGAHDVALFRPFSENDLQRMIHALSGMPCLLTTVAPEVVEPEAIEAMVRAGVVVSIGHSDATYDQAAAAAQAGATLVTHLFNAQSQLGNREPGIVGAALDLPLNASVIADGIHVHRATLAAAIRGKRGPGRMLLVTDAMAPMGTGAESFTLNGRTILRRDGALRLSDGTLAGADLTMIDAVRYVHRTLGVGLDEALRMASLYPAGLLRLDESRGHLRRGARADMVLLSDDLEVKAVWIGGEEAQLR